MLDQFKETVMNLNIFADEKAQNSFKVPPLWLVVSLYGLTSSIAWISNYTHYQVWDEITYPFQMSTVQPGMDE